MVWGSRLPRASASTTSEECRDASRPAPGEIGPGLIREITVTRRGGACAGLTLVWTRLRRARVLRVRVVGTAKDRGRPTDRDDHRRIPCARLLYSGSGPEMRPGGAISASSYSTCPSAFVGSPVPSVLADAWPVAPSSPSGRAGSSGGTTGAGGSASGGGAAAGNATGGTTA